MPVTIATTPPLAEPAQPVYVVNGAPPVAGRARRVVVVTTGAVKSGPAIPVTNVGDGALYTDDPPIPVFVTDGILDTLAYTKKVSALLGASLIAYWPLSELGGTIAADASGNGRTGTYTNVALGATGIGDGLAAASWNGSTSRCNVYSASLAGAFNGAEGTVAAWVRVASSGVWTDGTVRMALALAADGNNQIQIQRPADNNAIRMIYKAGGTTESIYTFSLTTTGWLHVALTWSKSADQVKAYVSGAQSGATSTTLGTWAGALATTLNCIGAVNTTPANVWSGTLAHVVVCNAPLAAATIAQLGRVP